MNRDEQEMALWAAEYAASKSTFAADRAAAADLAAAFFAHRYPPQPTAPEAVWYDEPPFAKDGRRHACWVTGEPHVQSVYWSITACEWRYCQPHVSGPYPLHNRRVLPIIKPQEPTT